MLKEKIVNKKVGSMRMKNTVIPFILGLFVSISLLYGSSDSTYAKQARLGTGKPSITFFDGSKTHHIVYTKNGELKVKNTGGLVYKKNSGILQIHNVKKGSLDIRRLPEKITIDVSGVNYLSYIHMDTPVKNTNVMFTGKGKLVLNKKRDNVVPMLLDLNGKRGSIEIGKNLHFISYKSSGAPDEFSDLNKNIFIRKSGSKESFLADKRNHKVYKTNTKEVLPNTLKIYLMKEQGQYETEPILAQEYTDQDKLLYVEKIYKDGGEPQEPDYRYIELDKTEQKEGVSYGYGHVVTMPDLMVSDLHANSHTGKNYELFFTDDVIRMK